MPSQPRNVIFVGIANTVLALEERTGDEVWRSALRTSDFTTVLWDGEVLIAASGGEAYRLDPATGAVLWNNKLKGLGRGIVSLASPRTASAVDAQSVLAAQRRRAEQEAAAAATAAS